LNKFNALCYTTYTQVSTV